MGKYCPVLSCPILSCSDEGVMPLLELNKTMKMLFFLHWYCTVLYADSVPHCAVSPPIIITHHTTKRIHNEQQSQIRNATEQHIAVEKFSYRHPKTTSFYTKISLLTGSFGNVLALGPGFDPPLA